jgi:anthranilate phosphoribosyltransferase
VVRGDDGLDKLTTTADSRLWVVRDGAVTAIALDARTLGIRRGTLAELRGGSPAANAEAMRAMLAGQPGAVRDVVLLNAAAAVAVALDLGGRVADQLAEGGQRCAQAIDSGAARRLLERWRAVSLSVTSGG